MYTYYEIDLSGFERVVFILSLCFVFSILTAVSLKENKMDSVNLMVRLDKLPSFLLFLFIFKRKVALWAVIIQICNYITLATSAIVYKVIGLDSPQTDRIFKIVIGTYFIGSIILMTIDMFIYDKRKNYH